MAKGGRGSSSKSGISRRKVLQSLTTATVGGSAIANAGASTLEKEPDEYAKVRELSGRERDIALRRAKTRGYNDIEREMKERREIVANVDAAKVLKVQEVNGEVRHVVSIPYKYDITDDIEIFIQYNGFDDIDNLETDAQELDASTEIGEGNAPLSNVLPNVFGYYINKNNSELEEYHIENGTVTTELYSEKSKTDSYSPSTAGNPMPVPCGNTSSISPDCGGSGICGTCLVNMGVDCSPSFSCLSATAIAYASNIAACGSCAASLGMNPTCAACIGLIYSNAVLTTDCDLGCDDEELVCIGDDLESTVC